MSNNEITEIRERTVRIETKLDAYMDENKEIKNRLATNEKTLWTGLGAFAALEIAWNWLKSK